MKDVFFNSKYGFLKSVFRQIFTVLWVSLTVIIGCIGLSLTFTTTVYADTQSPQTDPEITSVELNKMTVTATANIYSSYYDKEVEYKFSNVAVGKKVDGTPAETYVPNAKLTINWIEWSEENGQGYKLSISKNVAHTEYTYDDTDNVMKSTGKQISSGTFDWSGIMLIDGQNYYRIVDPDDNQSYWIVANNTMGVFSSNISNVEIKGYTLDYDKDYVAKDVTLVPNSIPSSTNLNKQKITVVGDKGTTTSFKDIPQIEGYTTETKTIDFTFDKDGNITPTEPEVEYISNDINKIPDEVNANISWNGQNIKTGWNDDSDTSNLQVNKTLSNEDKKNLLNGESVDVPTCSSAGDAVQFKTTYSLKWNNEKKQLYLTDGDSDKDIIWIDNDGNAQASLPMNIIGISVYINYYDADDKDKVIGKSTLNIAPDKNRNFTVNIPSLPSEYESDGDYEGKYIGYTSKTVTFNEKDIKIPQSISDLMQGDSMFYKNIYLQPIPMSPVEFFRIIYLNDKVYSSKKYLIPVNTSNFDSYAEKANEKPDEAKLSGLGFDIGDNHQYLSAEDIPSNFSTITILDGLKAVGLKDYSGKNLTLSYYYTGETPTTTSQDVILYTNQGKKIVHVTGNIPSKDVTVEVPSIDGYKKGNVIASIDSDGNVTLKNDDGKTNSETDLYEYVKSATDSNPSTSTSNSSTHAVKPTITKKNQLISTAIHDGFVSLYKIDGTNVSKVTDQALGAFSDWQSDEIVTIDGQKYYRVATDKWVKAQKVYVYQPLKTIVNTDQNWVYMKNNESKDITDRALDVKTSWKVDRIAYLDNDNTVYYRVATNEFVNATDVKK